MIHDSWLMGKIYFCFICVEFQTGNSLSRHKKTSEELRAQGDEYYVPLSIRNAEQEAPFIGALNNERQFWTAMLEKPRWWFQHTFGAQP